MSAPNINTLLDLWASTLLKHKKPPPFANHRDLYTMIDLTPLDDVAWQSFSLQYNDDEVPEGYVADAMEDGCLMDIPPNDGKSDTTISMEIEDMWESASDSIVEKTALIEVGHHLSKVNNPPPTQVDDSIPAAEIEDEWLLGSDKDGSLAAPATTGIEDNWLLASDNDSPPAKSKSSLPISNAWPILDNIPPNTLTAAPAPGMFCHYTLADFAYLQEHMFEEKLSDESFEYSE